MNPLAGDFRQWNRAIFQRGAPLLVQSILREGTVPRRFRLCRRGVPTARIQNLEVKEELRGHAICSVTRSCSRTDCICTSWKLLRQQSQLVLLRSLCKQL